MRCIMPPHWLHAGPRSRPCSLAGTTGGVSVKALVGALAPPLPPDAIDPRPPTTEGSPVLGPAVSEAITDCAASCAALRARTSGVRMPSSSWASTSRKRDASQRMM